MRHFSAWAAGALAAAIIIGCGPGKQLPDEVPKSNTTERTTTEPKEKVPTVSDPAAKEIVDRAIKACTQNNPDLLAKGKLSKVTANGTVKLPAEASGQFVEVPTFRTVLARWPDELKFTLDYKAHRTGLMTMILRGQFTWWGIDRTQNPNPNPQAIEDLMRTDGLAQHWLPLLFPLVEPKAVLFEPQKGVGTPPADVVRFALPERPVYQLFFDAATGHLTRVEYTHTELQARVQKLWTFSDHKPFAGRILPTKLEYTYNPERGKKDTVEQWTVENWEFPESFDDSVFQPPK